MERGRVGWVEVSGLTSLSSLLHSFHLPFPQGAGECIETLRSAGVRVWMLTGDKLETAVNIGYAARLLHDGRARTAIAPVLGGLGMAATQPACAWDSVGQCLVR